MATQVISSIRASGGDYTSLSAWIAAMQTTYPNLVTADVQLIAECYNDWTGGLVDSVTVSGFTTDATRNIIIRAASGHGHGGVIGGGFKITNSSSYCIGLTQDFSIVENIEAIQTSPKSFSNSAFVINGSNCVADRCIGKSNFYAFLLERYNNSPGVSPIARNCIAYSSGYGIGANTWMKYDIYNCTSVNCGVGFVDSHATGVPHTITNCVAHNCTTSYSSSNDSALTAFNNAASDATLVAPLGTNPLLLDVVDADFLDVTNGDYHLAAGSKLIDVGYDLTGIVDFDIDGAVRVAPFDIGADELGATVPVTITVLDQTTKQPVQNAHVYLFDSSYASILSGTTDVNGQYSTSIPIVTAFTASGWVRQYDLLNTDYKQSDITVNITAFGAQITILLVREI